MAGAEKTSVQSTISPARDPGTRDLDRPPVRILCVGEQGLALELGDGIDERINARVLRVGEVVSRVLSGDIEEVVPTYRSLLVTFDPLRIERAELARRIHALLLKDPELAAVQQPSRCLVVPVCYGGQYGADLEFVAAHAKLTAHEVIEIHAAATYRVYMLGFTPGFPHLGGMSPRIAAPRLERPRTRIKAGSVGIAGEQTGVYPIDSPGGWRLIGRTPLRFFDPTSDRPFLLAAGDYLRFRPIDEDQFRTLALEVEAGTYRSVPEAYSGGGVR